jgi:hypothetical protein
MAMAHDLSNYEPRIPLAFVPNLAFLPRKYGKKIHANAVFRWAQRGLGPNKIRLRTVQVGGMKCTTRTFLYEFFAALDESSGNCIQPAKHQNKDALQKIKSELEREGIF